MQTESRGSGRGGRECTQASDAHATSTRHVTRVSDTKGSAAGERSGAPCIGFAAGARPHAEADWAALPAAWMSADGRGAHTNPAPHALDWSPELLDTLQVITSVIPFMPFCAQKDTNLRPCCELWRGRGRS